MPNHFETSMNILKKNDNRSYVCDQCHKCFVKRAGLRKHMNIHLNIKPYNCTSCDLTFRYRATLNTHIRKKHRTTETSKDFNCHCGEVSKAK